MVKGRPGGVLVGVNEKKFRALRSGLAKPEAVLLGDPVGRDVRDVDAVAQIAGEKLLGSLIVLAGTLGCGSAYRKNQKGQ